MALATRLGFMLGEPGKDIPTAMSGQTVERRWALSVLVSIKS